MESLKNIIRSLIGSTAAREDRKLALRKASHYYEAIEAFDSKMGPDRNVSDERPIFIFSCGWRSGSTLLQRLICSSGDVLIWGEAYDKSCLIQKLTSTILPFTDSWPPPEYIKQPDSLHNLSGEWIASLSPPLQSYKDCHRNLILSLFSKPAEQLGAKRWGLKEVRFGLNEALYLKWLFPEAKFLYIERSVKSAFESYKQVSLNMNWYKEWPRKGAFTPFQFAKYHVELAREFSVALKATGGIYINYEDLISGKQNLKEIEEYCDINVNGQVLNKKIQGTEVVEKRKRLKLSFFDALMIGLAERVA